MHAQNLWNAARAVCKHRSNASRFYYNNCHDRDAYMAGVMDRLRFKIVGKESIVDSDAYPANCAAYEQGCRDVETVSPL